MKRTILLALFLLVSCNGKDNDSKKAEKRQESVECDKGVLCLAQVDLTIDSTSINFPKNFKLVLGENFLSVDTCKNPGVVKVQSSLGRTQLGLRTPWLSSDTYKVEILDLGENCDNDAIFFSDPEVPFSKATLTVNGKKSYSAYARLGN